MQDERQLLISQVLDAQAYLYRALRPAQEWLDLDLTTSQLKVLFVLYADGGASMGQLAGWLGVTLPTVTGIVDRLVEHGLVQRAEIPSDRRVVLSRLTPEGTRAVERLHQAGRARLAELLERLSLGDLQTIATGLRALCIAAGDREAVASGASDDAPATGAKRCLTRASQRA
jgi:DNA-binding MarR family transcriptional regulator